MHFPAKETEVVRELARRVAEIAGEDRMRLIKKRWMDVNALRKPDRAPVYCRPMGCWSEIIPEEALECKDPYLRKFEYSFRQTIYKRDVDDDSPVENYLEIPAVFTVEPENIWGADIGRYNSGVPGGAWRYDPPLKTEKDFERLRMPVFTYDGKTSAEKMEQAAGLFNNVMPVKMTVTPLLSATLGMAAADLRGLERMMMDMVADPPLMHRLMSFLRDAVLSAVEQVEATGLLTPNNTGPMNCSEPIGKQGNGGRLSCKNLWCMANSQEFDQVSPAMWEEFCLNYQKPLLERFGLAGYGCCENLTNKIDGVLSIPNLRIFVCSAWTDLSKVLEKTDKKYCIMWRQKASDVVMPDNTESIRKHLMDSAEKLRGYPYQIVLRELQTLAGHTNRLYEWTRLAKEAASKYS